MRANSVLPLFLLVAALLPACDGSDTSMFAVGEGVPLLRSSAGSVGGVAVAPPDLVTVSAGGETLDLWPYLSPDGETREDPVNLVFTGAASALAIRAALVSLDGDRTAFGFPPAYPFNATWSDAVGGVQAGYAGANGWSGSVIQLQLGNYGPVRFHLRLFETQEPFGDGGQWTLGGAHIEILIPGTPEHQVIAWEFAEQIVTVDLVRAGVLQAAPAATGAINDAPGFRTIPPAIYNGIPDALKAACGLPLGPSAVPVPIPTNGHATILELRPHELASGDGHTESFTIQFQQVIPKPFCAAGPADYYTVQGPVNILKVVSIQNGRYSYRSELSGHLTATPYPAGESFAVNIRDMQNGHLTDGGSGVNASIKRVAPQDGGSELLMQWLDVRTDGEDLFRRSEHCLTP